MQNYFNYFTEIEEHFQRRRGTLLLLSTLDWALIETWREAGVPLEAVLRGIDKAFDKHETKPNARTRRVNGLAWCAQAVMEAAQEMQEAAVGMARNTQADKAEQQGFESARVAAWLMRGADALTAAQLRGLAAETAQEIATRLREMATDSAACAGDLEALERNLLVLEEKLMTAIVATTAEAEMLALKEQSARELAPYKRKMQVAQIRQIEQQFLHKQLVDRHKLPRLSLFYMSQA
uniref:Uncharacterized protein n=1 Tax=Acidobacterium capsulatum TaxID=33075 RepID=A0A7V4XRW9_9BACT